jgi:hypothetical protein
MSLKEQIRIKKLKQREIKTKQLYQGTKMQGNLQSKRNNKRDSMRIRYDSRDYIR